MVAANASDYSKKFNPAQTSAKAIKANLKNQMNNSLVMLNMPQTNAASQAKAAKNLATKQSVRKVGVSAEGLAGSWVNEYTEDMTEDLDKTYQNATPTEVTVEEEDGVTYVTFADALDSYATELVGVYDAEAGTVTFPAQYCYEHATYGKFAFYGVAEDGETLETEYVMEVSTDDNGNIVLSSESAWVILMTEGDYEGYSWVYSANLVMYKANYTFSGSENHVTDGAWTGWNDTENVVYIEEIEDELFVHGIFGSTISMTFNESTGYYDIANGQDITYGWTGSEYIPFYLYNCDTSTGYVSPAINDDLTPADYNLPAYISSGGYLVFGETDGETVSWDNFAVALMTSTDGYGYWRNLWAGLVCEPMDDPAGIESVNTNSVKNNATYNIAGQQVANNFKGIVVKNGKKFLNK